MAIIKRITKGSSLTYQEMDDNLEQIAPRTSATGSLIMPSGTTAQRDGSAANGYLRYNTSLNQFEGYINGGWGGLGGGGGSGDPNQNAFSQITVSGQTSIDADNTTDTLNIAAGSNITLTTNAATDTLTIAATFSQDFAFSSLTGTPTTVAGYGITDAQDLLVSGTNIKTVNNQSLLGAGNITLTASTDWASITNKPNTIAGFGIIDAFDGAWSSLTGTPTTVSGYGITDAQEILVSGTNIKTINGVSVLGSGDLTVNAASYGDSDVNLHLNTTGANTNDVLSWNGTDFAWVAQGGGGGGSETDPVVGAITGIVKADGGGNISAAVAGSDYSTFDENYSSLQNHPTDLTTAGFTNASLLELVDVVNGAGANGQILTSNGSVFSFQDAPSVGGTTTFLGLTDTPSTFSGSGSRVLAVNAGATAIEFIAQAAGAESNDLTQSVTWDIVPDAYISNTSVVQHQTDLLLTLSQITDWDANNFIAAGAEQDPVFAAHTTYNIVNGSGFLRQDGAGNWFYDSNTYITAANSAPETDPIFTAHTTYNIANGTGFLINNGSGTWSYDTNTYLTANTLNETDPVFQSHTTYNIQNGSGLLAQDGAGNWYYDSNTYLTTATAETDPIFTAHTAYDITNGNGFLRQTGVANSWYYDANTYLTSADLPAESDPIFSAHTVADIVDGVGFLRQDGANNWYWDANTYITAADVPSTAGTLDDVTTNGNSTTNNAEFGGLTVGGNNVIIEGSNNALLTNGSNYITLTSLSASGDITYNNLTGEFSANVQSTGITTNDLYVEQVAAGTASLTYSAANGTFTYTPPDLSSYVTGEVDPVFTASAVANVVASATDGFLRNVGGEWYYDTNTYITSASAETDPVFVAHTTYNISDGTGYLQNDGNGNWSYSNGSVTETDPVFSAWTGSSIVDGTGRLQNDGTGTWSYDNTVYVANGQNISDLNNDAGYITGFTETNDLTAAVVWTNIPDAYVPQSAVTQHQAALSITGSQITDLTYTSNTNITIYKNTDGNLGEGTLVFESRDPSPTVGQSMGDIRFYMDTDNNVGTSTLGEYARISAKASAVGAANAHHGTLEFRAQNGATRGFETFMEMGVDPFDHDGTPNPVFVGTRHVRPFYGEDIVSCISEVATPGDMTSAAPIQFFMGAYDSSTGNYHTRGVLIHDSNVLRLQSHDATGNTNVDFTRLQLAPTMSNTALQFSDAVNGTVTDYTVAGTHNLQYIFDNNTINTVSAKDIVVTNSDQTPLDGDIIGRIKFQTGEDTFTAFRDYAEIVTTAQDTAAGAYDARMAMYVKGNGGTGANANIGLTLDGNSSIIRSRANHHYFGAFPATTVDNNTVPTDNYIKIIADDDATRQVIQSAGDMWFSVDTAVSSNTVMKIDKTEVLVTTGHIVIDDPFPEPNGITNEHAILDLKSNNTLVGRVAGTLDASANPVLKLGYDTTDFIYIKSDGLTLTDANTAVIAPRSQTDVSYTNFTSMSGDSGVTVHDLSTGSVFYHSFIAGDITANFTNVYFADDTFFTVRLVMSQGATAYMPTAVQIGGVAQTIQWDGGSAPTGTANATDVVEFDIYCFQTNSYTVLARHTLYD